MLRRITHRCLLACLLALLYADGDISDIPPRASAQTATPVVSPQPTPLHQQQEPIKIYTEDVILPVVATDSSGRFDPTLINDLLVLEDGEPQTIRSVLRIPASVLLLLDTGGFRNPAMKTNTTRDLSMRLVSQLKAHR